MKTIAQKGRGMFASEAIPAFTVIEIAPVIVMPLSQKKALDKTLLHDYIFMWGPNEEQCCMALGMVPIYNHAYSSNCEYVMDYENNTIIIQTILPVQQDDELTINYNGAADDDTPIWFDAQ
ncbi:SET domain-containing protein-lysine N-methyltransferase [Ferruginibacter yonginensis]|uniref:SET domain-containing protein-lysine N-methyltransferase n=1 Tax=Ferruginibacter yonginensis TaxID=1310416 RepID=A0ABV8QWS0_9BACT